MARIVDAGKVEVLREVVIEDNYPDVRLVFRVDKDGDVNLVVEIVADPRVSARNEVRTFIENLLATNDGEEPEDMTGAIMAELDRLDARTQMTWGETKGKQLPWSTNVYFERKINDVLANLFGGGEINGQAREAIRESLSVAANTKGF